ncbi:MAG: hypothetical protein HQL69_24075 [Magnetococcales bacterium]|nr:hypothetical protein [Magnetococcales bacterium]
MTQVQPQSKLESLHKDLLRIPLGREIDVVTSRRLEIFHREVKSLISFDPAYAQLILGHIATLRHNFSEMQRCYQSALREPTDDLSRVYTNYASSLNWFGASEEALANAKEAWRVNPQELNSWETYISGLINCGWLREVVSVMEQARSSYNSEKVEKIYPIYKKAVQVLDENNLSDEEVSAFFIGAARVCRETGGMRGEVIAKITHDEDSEWVSIRNMLMKSHKATREVEDLWRDWQVKNQTNPLLGVCINLRFSPVRVTPARMN